MNFIIYINHWDEISSSEKFIVPTEQDLKLTGYPFKILNASDKDYEDRDWIKIGAIWYSRTLYYALKDFDPAQYDYFGFMTADVMSDDWQLVLDRATEVMNKYTPASYSPYSNVTGFTIENSSICQLNDDKDLYESIIQDGQFVFYHKDVVKKAIEYYEYFESKYDHEKLRSAWGTDFLFSAICLSQNKIMIKDNKYIVKHCLESQYMDINERCKEFLFIIQTIIDFFDKDGIDVRPIMKELFDKVVYTTWLPIPPNFIQ